MKSMVLLFIKSFLLIALLAFCYKLLGVTPGAFGLESLVREVVVPALMLTVVLLSAHLVLARLAGVRANYSANQATEVISNLDLGQLQAVVQRTTRWNLVEARQNLLVFRSSFESLKSFGEQVTLARQDNKIVVTSKPVLPTTLFDFGKNYQNVHTVETALQQVL